MGVQEKQPRSRKNLALAEGYIYKSERYRQLGLADLDQSAGLKMDPKKVCKHPSLQPLGRS